MVIYRTSFHGMISAIYNYVPANTADFEGIDLFLRDRGITSVKKVSAFQQLGPVGRGFR